MRPPSKLMRPGLRPTETKIAPPQVEASAKDALAPIAAAIARIDARRAALAREAGEGAPVERGGPGAPGQGTSALVPSLRALMAAVAPAEGSEPPATPSLPVPLTAASPARRIELLDARRRGLERYLEARKKNPAGPPAARPGPRRTPEERG